jgi:signal peptidase II
MTQGSPQPWLWGRFSALGLAVAASTAVIDQAHKWWMILVYEIEAKGRVAVLPFLDFVYVLNKGISYSLLSMETQGGQRALAAFAFVASVALWIWISRAATNRLMTVSLALILGGAVGNGIDRLTLGGVADFFLLHTLDRSFTWYVFNIADVAIVAGVVGLLYESLITSRKDAVRSL